MKSVVPVAILLFIVNICTTANYAQQADSIKQMPPENLMRNPKIDVKHIALDLRFDWKKKQAYGNALITFAPLERTRKIALDAVNFTIISITLANGVPLKFDYNSVTKNDGLEVLMDHMYSPNQDITIKIAYNSNWVNEIDPNNLGGSMGNGLRFSEPTSNDPRKPREIYSISDPESNRYWFPCFDSPNDLRTTELKATVENSLTVISNGTLISTKDNKDGTRTFHWAMKIPYPNHLTSIVVGKYVNVKQNYQDIQLHNFGYPDEKNATTATVIRLPDMMKFFSGHIGAKYPYSSYSQVFVQDLPNWVGNCATSTITENMVDDKGTHDDFFYLWDLTEGEALAHQWFGNHIAAKDWSDVWINKAFPRYMSGLYDEYKNGKDEFLSYVLSYDQSVYLGDWNAGYRHPIVTKNYANIQAFTSDNYAYYRGAAVLHMLRKHLGSEIWWKAIRLYVKKNGNKSVTTKDFIKAVEEASGESMKWFFDQWLYKMGHPVFEVTKQYDSVTNQLTLYVHQTQKIDPKETYPQVDFFQGKVDIEIDRKIMTVLLEPKAENKFSFSLTQIPKLVNFDYGGTWLKEIVFKEPLDELLYQLENDKDILGRLWALGEIAKVFNSGDISLDDKNRIKQSFRNTLSGNSYWRLKVAALSQLRKAMSVSPNGSIILDAETEALLLEISAKEKSWLKSSAINFLGMTNDNKYADIYLNALTDSSDRVISQAAIALGKTKNPKAFDALAKLVYRPSMKSQSLISALNGLKELGDKRGADIAYKALADVSLPRWRLPTGSIWDYRVFAAQTMVALGKGSDAYTLILPRLKKAMKENDLNGIFDNVLLVATIADSGGSKIFDELKDKFKNDENAMNALRQYESLFVEALNEAKKK